MSLRIAAAKAIKLLRRDGVTALAHAIFRHVISHKLPADTYDSLYGTDTGGVTPAWSLDVVSDSPNQRFAVKYQASEAQELTDAITYIGVARSSFIFVDLGCGKGRALIVAAKLGFRRVVGIEFARTLANIADTNLTKLKLTNANVICGDAAEYIFPNDDFVLYLYNPFADEVMRCVLENLRTSHAKTIFIIYKRPVCQELFDHCGFLVRVGSPPGNDDIIVWASRTEPSIRESIV